MSRHHHRHRRFKLRSFYVWHRYMGISAAVFVLVIAITGALLNHTGDFKFDSRHVQSAWILDWYGIKAPERLYSCAAGDRRVTLMEDTLYLDRTAIDGSWQALHGAARVGDMVVIAVDNIILLVTPSAEVVERLGPEDAVPQGIEQIGVSAEQTLIVRAAINHYQTDSDFIHWNRWQGDPSTVQWSQASPVAAQLKASLQDQYRNRILPVERLLLDLHSGRFFGRAGPWVFDIAALLLVLLALSGTVIWLKRKR